MELTRTKHWNRIWSCVQSLMSPGVLIGTGLTSYLGKPGFYACATCVLIGAGLIGFHLIDITKCGSPNLSSSVDNESPIPPAPPPITPNKYGHGHGPGTAVPGMYPLRRSISLQQPFYPCCPGETSGPSMRFGYNPYAAYPTFYPYCRECIASTSSPFYPNASMIRSYSLPQQVSKTTGTQTNPNSPEKMSQAMSSSYPSSSAHVDRSRHQVYPGSFDRIPVVTLFDSRENTLDKDNSLDSIKKIASYKNTVMFSSNPQLFPPSLTHSSASTTDRDSPLDKQNERSHGRHHQNFYHPHPHQNSQRTWAEYSHSSVVGKENKRTNLQHSQQRSFDQSMEFTEHFPVMTTAPVQHHVPPKSSHRPAKLPPPAIVTGAPFTVSKTEPKAFTRHHFDSSKIPDNVKQTKNAFGMPIGVGTAKQTGVILPSQDKFHKHPRYQRTENDPYEDDPDPPYYPASKQQPPANNKSNSGAINNGSSSRKNGNIGILSTASNNHHENGKKSTSNHSKVSSSEFDIEQPKFNSLRRTDSAAHRKNSSSLGQYGNTTVARHDQNMYPPNHGTQPQFYSAETVARMMYGFQAVPAQAPSSCPYCENRPPPLSLSVPAIPPTNPHYMCHYGHPPPLRRRNTWHFHRDGVQPVITTSV